MKTYWELDDRGKFIRTLWMMPFAILAIALLLSMRSPIFIAASIYLFLILMAQLIDNYRKWKGKSEPNWQQKMNLLLIMPNFNGIVLVIALMIIIHLLLLFMADLLPISHELNMIVAVLAHFLALLFVFVFMPSRK